MDNKKLLDEAWAKEEKLREDKAKAEKLNQIKVERQQAKDWKKIEGHVLHHKVVSRLNDIIDWYKAKCEEIFPGTDLHYEKLELRRRKGLNPPPYESATYVYDIGSAFSENEFSSKLQITCNCQYWWFIEEQEYYEEGFDPDDEDGVYALDTEHTEEMFEIVRNYFIEQLNLVVENKDFYDNPLKYT